MSTISPEPSSIFPPPQSERVQNLTAWAWTIIAVVTVLGIIFAIVRRSK